MFGLSFLILLFLAFLVGIVLLLLIAILLHFSFINFKGPILKSLDKGDSILKASFLFSYKANLIFWGGACLIHIIWNPAIMRDSSLLHYFVAYIFCTIITTFTTGLLLTIILNFLNNRKKKRLTNKTLAQQTTAPELTTIETTTSIIASPEKKDYDPNSVKEIKVVKNDFIQRQEEFSLKKQLTQLSKTKYGPYLGIIIGGLYGLLIRGVFESFSGGIFSVTFIIFVPILIALIPIFFAQEALLQSKTKQFFYPCLSVALFLFMAFASKMEDTLCIAILLIPYLLIVGIVGIITGFFIKKRINSKLLSIFFLPFLMYPLETVFYDFEEHYTVSSVILIDADKTTVWKHLIEVPEIQEQEYEHSIFDYLGVPRPVKSELKIIDGEQYRIGYFSEGLELYESISKIDTTNFVSFNIHMDESKLRDVPTDQHILNSNLFVFESISYRLFQMQQNTTKLELNCDYRITSKMNMYANFWAAKVIEDFEEKLLLVLKNKIETPPQKIF